MVGKSVIFPTGRATCKPLHGRNNLHLYDQYSWLGLHQTEEKSQIFIEEPDLSFLSQEEESVLSICMIPVTEQWALEQIG